MVQGSELVRSYVLDAVANDYESFQTICEQVFPWAETDGVVVEEGAIRAALEELVAKGHIAAYMLSAAPPAVRRVSYARGELHNLWFYITQEGKSTLTKPA